MTDIHTHILPNIDDGARGGKISQQMLRALAEQGVTQVALTPHYYGRLTLEKFLRLRKEAYEKIVSFVPQGMKVLLGAEVHFSESLSMTAECSALSLGDTRYMLVELPYGREWTKSLLQKLRYFMDATEKIPVVAHFCRYEQVRKNPRLLSELADMGCLLQFNAESLWDKKAKKVVYAAMRHGLAHCIGTDCHDTERRAPNYLRAIEEAKRAGYAEEIAKIVQTTSDVFCNRALPKTEYTPIRKAFGRYL